MQVVASVIALLVDWRELRIAELRDMLPIFAYSNELRILPGSEEAKAKIAASEIMKVSRGLMTAPMPKLKFKL